MTTYDWIKQAIEEKKSLNLVYNDHIRQVCPCLLGSKNGKYYVLCYQYGGGSVSGLSADTTKNWRCLEVDKISAVQNNQDEFQVPENHSTIQSCVENIDIELNYQA